jgi:hypothetical protein
MEMRKFIFSERIHYSLCAMFYSEFRVVQVIPHFKSQEVQIHGHCRAKYLLTIHPRKLHYSTKYVYVKVTYKVGLMLNTVRGFGTDISTADILHVYGTREKLMSTVW